MQQLPQQPDEQLVSPQNTRFAAFENIAALAVRVKNWLVVGWRNALAWFALRYWRTLSLLFLCLVALFLVNSLLAYRSLTDISSREHQVSHTQVVLTQLALILKTIDDAETGQRGYILTGDATYLKPYTAARATLPVVLNHLQALIANEPTQQQHLVTLRGSINTKLGELQQTVTLRQQGQTSAALAIVLTGQGEQEMDSIRSTIATMQANEEHLLTQHHSEVESSIRNAGIALVLASLADIILLVGMFLFVLHFIREHQQYLMQEQRARQQAEEALLLRDHFLSIASHELKTPVTALLANMQILERRLGREGILTERNQKAISSAEQQIQRLRRLLDTMLDVSRIDHGQLLLSYQMVDLVALVHEVVDEMQQTTTAHRLELTIYADTLAVEGDSLRLEQVLRNLLQNAIKYSPAGGLITITLELSVGYSSTVANASDILAQDNDVPMITLRVQDQGIGISPEAQTHLFERFYRAPNANTGHAAGLGIGLFVVKEIVTLHGGDISATSEEGAGTTFTVHLPLAHDTKDACTITPGRLPVEHVSRP